MCFLSILNVGLFFIVYKNTTVIAQVILRFIVFCSLWSYGVATILPIEKIILETNIALTESADTRIKFGYLQGLSADVLKDIQKFKNDKHYYHKYLLNDELTWSDWLIERSQNDCRREWYERNLSLVLNCYE